MNFLFLTSCDDDSFISTTTLVVDFLSLLNRQIEIKDLFILKLLNSAGSFIAQSTDQVLNKIRDALGSNFGEVLCLGLNDVNIGLSSYSPLLNWAIFGDCPRDLLLTPGHANISPPNHSFANWTTLIYFELHGKEKLLDIYQSSLKYMRPGDFIVFIISVERRISRGDNRAYSRFEFGKRLDWSAGPPMKSYPFYSNDNDLEILIGSIKDLLLQSKLEGVVRVEYDVQAKTKAQLFCKAIIEERADLIIIKQNQNVKNLIVECVQESSCSIAILK